MGLKLLQQMDIAVRSLGKCHWTTAYDVLVKMGWLRLRASQLDCPFCKDGIVGLSPVGVVPGQIEDVHLNCTWSVRCIECGR